MESNTTTPMRRDQVKPGMLVHSSHGYDLLVTEVRDNAEVRTDQRMVEIVGHLHGDPNAPLRNERYEAHQTIEVYADYATVYEAELRALLSEWADENIGAGPKARAQFVERITGKDDNTWREGPFADAMRNHADDVIHAEYRTHLAANTRAMLDRTEEPMTAQAVLDALGRACNEQMREALTGGRSTSPYWNLVVEELGRAAHKAADGSWDGWPTMANRAQWAAKHTLAKDEYAVLYDAKKALGEAQAAQNRARTDASKARLQDSVDAAAVAVQDAEYALQARLVAAGAPGDAS